MNKIILNFIFILVNISLYAQELSIKISPNPAQVGENILLQYTINEKATNFIAPEINDLVIISGPNASSQSSYSFVNGKTQSSITTTYSFYLRAYNKGSFKIPPAYASVNGKKIKSKIATIEVNSSQTKSKKSDKISNKKNKNLFIDIELSKKKIILGEPVSVEFKLYNRLNGLSNLIAKSLPKFNGFWIEEIPSDNQRKIEEINNKVYEVYTIAKYTLIPQKSGNLIIDPIEIICQYFFDQKIVKSLPKEITVTNPENMPKNYSGLVGKMKIESEISNDTVKANEAVNYSITITGTGNIALLTWDDILTFFPKDFEVIKSKIDDNKVFKGGMERSVKKLDYVLIPKFKGKYNIPSSSIIVYNSQKKSYSTYKSSEETLIVIEGDNSYETESRNYEKEINYISEKTKLKKPIKFSIEKLSFSDEINRLKYFDKLHILSINIFYILTILPIFIFLIIKIYIYFNSRKIFDNKNKKMQKIAQKRLKNAKKCMKKKDFSGFFEEVEKSLWNYFAFKFKVESSNLSKESVYKYFSINNLSDEIQNRFIDLLNECEYARFSSINNENMKMEEILGNAKKIIMEVEKSLK